MARKRYNKGKRVDMRQGGRVRLAHGGEPQRENFGQGRLGQEAYNVAWSAWNAAHADDDTTSTPPNPFPDTGNIPYGNVTEDQATKARTQIEDAAKGTLPADTKIPTPQKLKTGLPEGFSFTPFEGVDYPSPPPVTPKKGKASPETRSAYGPNGQIIQVPVGTQDYEADVTTMGTTADARAARVGTVPRERVSTQRAADPARKQAERTAEDATTERVTGKTRGPKTAEGKVTREAEVDEIRTLTQEAEAAGMPSDQALEKAKADVIVGQLSAGAIAAKQTGVGGQMADTPQAEAKSREAITGTAPQGDAAQIGGIPTLQAATRQAVSGTARTGAAVDMLAETGDLPPAIAEAVMSDPATVTAQMDTEDVSIQAAVASLPTEALVSSQMETLLAGMEEGQTPVWARPAVAAVQEMLAQRGLDVSTVGRDSLFNAIIQTALPMAQSNAQALQQRAAQNLSNEQQANLQASQQDMQRRMSNVANSQTAASQSAQMAQQVAIQQGTFGQQAALTTAQLQQQTRVQNLQNQQEAARLTAAQQQQANLANLSNEQQMEVLNLQVEADRLGTEFSAEQQVRLAQFQTAADFMAKNAAFTQDMEKANLSSADRINLANLAAQNQAAAETMSSAEKVELANLEAKVRVGVNNANLANSMGIAQLSSDQAIAMQNAQIVAGMDMANFSAEQQTQLANSKFMQSITAQDFSQEQQAAMQNATAMASLDMATVDQRTKLAITNAQSFLQMDMANLNNEQQSFVMDAQMRQQALLSDQAAANAASQFNAASQNQLDQYMTGLAQQVELTNKQRNDAMQQFNATQQNAAEARRAGNVQQANMLSAQLQTDVSKFNEQQEFNREQFNASQANAIEQYNVGWRREANKIDTAAVNAVNQQNAQNAFSMSSQAMSFMWQELRDQMDYSFRTYDNDQQRKASLIVAALGNEQAADEDGWSENWSGFGSLVSNFLGG